jgi:hypothetical protein
MKSKHIYISDSFHRYLEQIKEDSPIAALLASQNIDASRLVENHIDFLSISNDDPYKISYLTPERVEKIQKNDEDVWTSPSRYHTKYGSFVNKIFNCFDNREVEKFSNLLRSVVGQRDLQFKVVSGDEIPEFYHYTSYADQAGTLGQSCMKHDGCGKFLELYTQNPESVKMLIALDSDDKLIGRALLWELESHKVMDRIYTINDEQWSYYFKQWANKNGFLYKAKQNWNWTYHLESNGKQVRQKLSLKLKNFSFEYYPYVDTFKWINTETGELFNYKPDNENNIKVLISGDGSVNRYAGSLGVDSLTDAYEHKDLLKNLHYKSKEEPFNTAECNLYWSSINDCYLLRDDSEFIREFDDYIFNENFEEFNDRELINQRLDAIKNRDKVVKEELEKIENKIITEGEIIDILNNHYRTIHERSDIISIMTSYLEQRTNEIEYERSQEQARPARTTRRRSRASTWLDTALTTLETALSPDMETSVEEVPVPEPTAEAEAE